MDDSYKPIGEARTAYEDLGPTRPSICGPERSTKSPPPAHIRKLIAELGFRYRPSAQADLQAHAARLALLAADVADVPERHLRAAVEDWAKRERFMPTAAELITRAKQIAEGPRGDKPPSEKIAALRQSCAGWNRTLYATRPELAGKSEWRVDDDGNAFIHDMSSVEIAERNRFGGGR